MRKVGLRNRHEWRSQGQQWVKWSPSFSREGSKKPDKYWYDIDIAIEAPKESRLGQLIIYFTEEV
jgi:hypothetical protein